MDGQITVYPENICFWGYKNNDIDKLMVSIVDRVQNIVGEEKKMSQKGCVMGDHSFKHGSFPIQIQYLTTALGRILFKFSGYGIDFSTRLPWYKFRADLIFLPHIYSLVSLLHTLFVRVYMGERVNPFPH